MIFTKEAAWDITKVIIPAIIGGAAAFYGADIGTTNNMKLWQNEKIFQVKMTTFDKRVGILSQIVTAHSMTSRAANIKNMMVVIAQKAEIYGALCESKQSILEKAKCLVESSTDISIQKELAEIQANYFVNLTLANAYFCDKTRAALVALHDGNKDKSWWEAPSKLQDDLVNAMQSELTCQLDQVQFR